MCYGRKASSWTGSTGSVRVGAVAVLKRWSVWTSLMRWDLSKEPKEVKPRCHHGERAGILFSSLHLISSTLYSSGLISLSWYKLKWPNVSSAWSGVAFPRKEIGFFHPWYVSVFFFVPSLSSCSSTHCILDSVLITPIKYHHFWLGQALNKDEIWSCCDVSIQ